MDISLINPLDLLGIFNVEILSNSRDIVLKYDIFLVNNYIL
jgi:hypothetical protein